MANKRKPAVISSVGKALKILDIFIEEQHAMGAKEISDRLDINFSTTHHLLKTLCLNGYIKQDQQTKKYGLGIKSLQLGLASQGFFQQIADIAKPVLKDLVSKVNEDVNLAIVEGNEIIYIAKESSSHAMRTFTRLGGRAPLYCTGVGKIFLAYRSPDAVEKYFEQETLDKRTENTITSLDVLKAELSSIRRNGYALDREENEEGVGCIAVPVKNYDGEVKVAISVSGLYSRIVDNMDYLHEELASSASTLSQDLGRSAYMQTTDINNENGVKTPPIGIFDSGMGGFSVLKPLLEKLPGESILYFGDTGRRPYGPKPLSEIKDYVLDICNFLVNKKAKLIIIACYTASVAGEYEAQKNFPDIPIIGMVGAGVESVLKKTKNKRVAVLGTKCTIDSGVFQKSFVEHDPAMKVYPVATEELLRMAELGGEAAGFSRSEMIKLASEALPPALLEDVDTVLLACTDFPCIIDIIEEVVEDKAIIVNPTPEVALQVEEKLHEQNKINTDGSNSELEFFISGDDVYEFNTFGKEFLGIEVSAKIAGLEGDYLKGVNSD